MISVVIPCYNQARFLPDAVASVVAQTYSDWELLIVDDGSTDGAATVAQALVTRYQGARMTVLSQPNCGLAHARNSGAAHAHGEYLLFLDSDDMIASSMLEHAAGVLDTRPEVGFVYSGIRLFGHDHHTRPGLPFSVSLLALDNIVAALGLVRHAVWHQIGGYDEGGVLPRGFEDWDFWLRAATAGWQGVGLREPLFYYRRHAASMSSDGLPHEWDTRAILVLRHQELYGPRLVAWANRHCARHSLPTRPVRYNERVSAARVIAQSLGMPLAATCPFPVLPPSNRQGISLAQHAIRGLPFAFRLQARWALRRAQYALRASGFWP